MDGPIRRTRALTCSCRCRRLRVRSLSTSRFVFSQSRSSDANGCPYWSYRCQRLSSSCNSLDHRTQTAVHTGPIAVNVSLRLVTVSIIGHRRLSILVPSLSTSLFVFSQSRSSDADGCPYWSHRCQRLSSSCNRLI